MQLIVLLCARWHPRLGVLGQVSRKEGQERTTTCRTTSAFCFWSVSQNILQPRGTWHDWCGLAPGLHRASREAAQGTAVPNRALSHSQTSTALPAHNLLAALSHPFASDTPDGFLHVRSYSSRYGQFQAYNDVDSCFSATHNV